jgi:hypothetical protein
MLISRMIGFSEARYKKILGEFFGKIAYFSNLPSHGIEHHRRVWHYAKEILTQLELYGYGIDQALTDNLIVASWLHDSGMSIDQGFSHGIEGRKICERFLSENGLSTDYFSEALAAIENHDNKEYLVTNRPGELLTILSVADDLDAFGYIGIYRYLEIYITRKIPLGEIGLLVSENCDTRFQNFLRSYGRIGSLIEKHTPRYHTINSFFNDYNNQAISYIFDIQMNTGFCGVGEVIMKLVNAQDKKDERDLVVNYPDPVIQWFFGELSSELSVFPSEL